MPRVTDDQEAQYAWQRVPGWFYISKRFNFGEPADSPGEAVVNGPARIGTPARFAYEVLASEGQVSLLQRDNGYEVVLRETEKERQQFKALFFQDDRAVQRLVFQRFTAKGKPFRNPVFSLSGEEVAHLREFLALIETAPVPDGRGVRLDSDIVREVLRRPEASAEAYAANPTEMASLIRGDINAQDVLAVARRRQSFEVFESLLEDEVYFEKVKAELGKQRDEDVWQGFFEENRWIFGFGLAAQLLIGWDEAKFEAVIEGTTAWGRGKKTDALMRTAGVLSSLCFVEIKLPTASLLNKEQYRPEAWAAGKDLIGGVAQLHTTLDKAIQKSGALQMKNESGLPVGQPAYVCRPRSYLLIGRHDEFLGRDGRVNESMYRSF